MAIYELANDGIRAIEETTYAKAGVLERSDLQRLLRDAIEVISPDTLVIAEEFGEWEESKRRIDLLGIDKDANLVVIELKRTQDGGRMELQAIRYAAMISTMTFDDAVNAYRKYLRARNCDGDPEELLLNFLEWEDRSQSDFAPGVRIVLAAADFSKELTTSVMWLNEQRLDITCMRLKPYKDAERILFDVQRIIPLPEADDYIEKIRQKKEQVHENRKSRRETFDVSINGQAYERLHRKDAMFAILKHLCDAGISPEQIMQCIPWRPNSLFHSVAGDVDSQTFLAMASQQGKGFNAAKFFCGDDELIHWNGSTYAFASGWGPRTGKAIGNLLEAFPEKLVSCERHRDA